MRGITMRTKRDRREYLKGFNDMMMFIHNLSLSDKLDFCYLLLFRPKLMKRTIRGLVREGMRDIRNG